MKSITHKFGSFIKVGTIAALTLGLVFANVTPALAAIAVGNVTTDTGSGSLVIPVPSGTTSGDLLLVGIVVDGGSGTSVTTPSGWTFRARVDDNDSGWDDNAGDDVSLLTYYKVAGSSEPASYTWTIGGSQEGSGGMIRYIGVDTTTPINVSGSSNGDGSTATAPAVTTTVANTRVVAFYGADNDFNFATSSGMTERYDVPFNSSDDIGSAADDVAQASVGSTGTKSSSMGSGNNASWVAQTIALRPFVATSTITIVKDAIPNDAQDFSFTTTGTGLSSFSLDDDADPALSNTKTFTGLSAGTYSVAEAAVAGWDLASAICSDGSPVSAISLSAGEAVTCTFTNSKRGHIIVDKVTDPSGNPQSFSFDAVGGSYADFALADAAAPNDQVLILGNYSVSETVPAGWDQTSAICVSSIGDTETPSAIELDAGETVTCTFTNTKLPTLTVTKVVVNNSGGTKTVSDFPLFIDGSPATSSVPKTVSVGAHIVSETSSASYTATIGGDCDADGNITLAAGNNKTCTITNDDIHGDNLVPNPSLENGTPGSPDNWAQGGWGTNTTVYTYPVTGTGGAGTRAAKVEITNYTDGDAKWYFDEVPVTPGQYYAFSDKYISDITGSVEIQYNMGGGVYEYGKIGASAPSAGWQAFEGGFIAPAGAVSATIFHLINGVGSLTVDDYSLMAMDNPYAFDEGMVTLAFDDGWKSIYTNGIPILNDAGFKSTQYIYTDAVLGGFSDYMNAAEVVLLDSAGHDITAHSRSHTSLTTPPLTSAQMEDEVDGSRYDLLTAPFGLPPVDSFAYPYGNYDAAAQQALREAGFVGARTVENGLNDKSTDRYALKAMPVQRGGVTPEEIVPPTTLAEVQAAIDTATASKTWLILLFHQIDSNGANAYGTTPEMLQDVVDYLTANGVSVITASQGLHLMPGVPAAGDASAPTIAAHGDETVPATSPAGATVTYTEPIVTDNIDVGLSAFCLPASGSTFPLGDTLVTCTAADTSGNLAAPTSFVVHVTKANQTITFDSLADKTYGDAPFDVSATSSSGLPVSFSILSGPATISTSTVTITGAGTVTVRASQAGDSTYNPAPDVDRSFAVAQATVTPVVEANNKTYDGTTDATLSSQTLTGVIDADIVNLEVGAANFDTKDVGTGKTVTATGLSLSGSDAGDYVLSDISAATTADITAAAVVVSATGNDKIYDGTIDATVDLEVTGEVGGDVLGATGSAAFDGADVGPHAVHVSGITLTGTNASNYTSNDTTDTVASIMARDLTVSATADNKTYDGTADAIAHLTTDALLGDDVTASYVSALFSDANVEDGKAVAVSGISIGGSDAGNYNLLNTTADTTANIAARAIEVTADAQSRIYGDADPALTYQITSGSLVSGDDFSGELARDAGDSIGSYPITQNTLSLSSNYTLTFVGDNLTITKKPLTVTADSGQTKVHGDSDPVFTYTNDPLVGADLLTGALERVSGDDVGTYAITLGTLTAGGNYEINFVSADFTITAADTTVSVTNAGALGTPTVAGQSYDVQWSVTPVPPGSGTSTGSVTVTVNGDLGCTAPVGDGQCAVTSETTGSKNLVAHYSGDTNFNPSESAGVSHDVNKADTTTTITSDLATPTVVGQSYTVQWSVTVNSPGAGVPIGTVTVSGGSDCSADVSAGQCDVTSTEAGEKTLIATYSGDANFNGSVSGSASHTVNKADTTTVASSSLNPSVYGDSVQFAAAMSVTAPGSGEPTGTAQFKIDGSDFGAPVALASSSATSDGIAILTVGDHIVIATYSGDDNFSTSVSSDLTQTVGKKTLTATADNQNIAYGDPEPAFTVRYSGFVNGEDSGVLDTPPIASVSGPHSDVGAYPIEASGGLDDNYDFIYVNGTLTVSDNEKPVITRLGDAEVTLEVHSVYTDAGATASDNYDGDLTSSIVTVNPVDDDVLGDYTVTYNVTDSNGNAAVEVTRTVHIVDTTSPTIELIGDNPQTVEAGSPYVELGATVTDNYDTGLIPVIDASAVNTSVINSYDVTYDASDLSGNTSTQVIRTVVVQDTIYPVVTIDLVFSPTNATPSITFSVEDATAVTTECKVDDGSFDSCVSPFTPTLATGEHTVTVQATDAALKIGTSTATFTTDATAPVVTIDPPLLGEFINVNSATITFSVEGEYATLTCKLNGSDVTPCAPPSVELSALAEGAYDFTIEAVDSLGNASVVPHVIFTVDTIKPIVHMDTPADPTGDTTPSITFTVEDATAATTECKVDGGEFAFCESPFTTDELTDGPHTIIVQATDAAGNVSDPNGSVTFTVDTTAPNVEITAQPPAFTNVDSFVFEFSTSDPEAILTCTMDGAEFTACESSTSQSYSGLSEGPHIFTVKAADSLEHYTTDSADFTVDTIAPVIGLLGDNPMTVEVYSAYDEPGATVTDDSETNLVIDALALDTDHVGSYPVTYDAQDAAGNAAEQAIRTINVVDTQAPVIELVGANPQIIVIHSPYIELGATVTDNYDTGLIAAIDASAVNTGLLGTYNVTYDASDSSINNADQKIREVRVVDSLPPVITLTGSSTINLHVGDIYTELGATAYDDVDHEIASTSIAIGGGTVNTAVMGTYVVTYNVSDSSGNAATQVTRTVNVIPTIYEEVTASSTTNSITVIWTTDHEATSRVIYDTVSHPDPITGSAPNYGYANSTTEDATPVTSHSVVVSGLSAGTTYYLRPVSHGSPEALGSEVSAATNAAPVTVNVVASGGGGGGSYTYAVRINNGASQTTVRNVTLSLYASYATLMWLSNDSSFSTSTGSWIPFQSTYAWTLAPEVGAKTVYARFSQAGGSSIMGNAQTNIQLVEAPAGQVLGATTTTYIFTRTLSVGSRGDDVTELQKRLTQEGVYSGPITGYFGPLTEAGVKAFQEKNGLEQVGIVGPKTRALLNQGSSGTATPAPSPSLTDEQRATIAQQILTLLGQITALQAKLKTLQGQ